MKLNIQRFTDPTAVTKKTISAFNTATAWGVTDATVDTANGKEEFTFTAKAPRPIIYLENGGDADGDGFTCVVKKGIYPFAQDKSIFVDYGQKVFVELEEGYNEGASGVITLELTPETGKKLVTDCVAKVGVLETI